MYALDLTRVRRFFACFINSFIFKHHEQRTTGPISCGRHFDDITDRGPKVTGIFPKRRDFLDLPKTTRFSMSDRQRAFVF
jgi:hypothetical protein